QFVLLQEYAAADGVERIVGSQRPQQFVSIEYAFAKEHDHRIVRVHAYDSDYADACIGLPTHEIRQQGGFAVDDVCGWDGVAGLARDCVDGFGDGIRLEGCDGEESRAPVVFRHGDERDARVLNVGRGDF